MYSKKINVITLKYFRKLTNLKSNQKILEAATENVDADVTFLIVIFCCDFCNIVIILSNRK